MKSIIINTNKPIQLLNLLPKHEKKLTTFLMISLKILSKTLIIIPTNLILLINSIFNNLSPNKNSLLVNLNLKYHLINNKTLKKHS